VKKKPGKSEPGAGPGRSSDVEKPSCTHHSPQRRLLPLHWAPDGEGKLDHGGALSASEPAGGSVAGNTFSAKRNAAASRRECLRGANPAQVLACLVQGDPLGVRVAVRAALVRRALLLDADRAYLRCLARCARYATDLRAHAALGRWLAQHVDAAIDELLRSEARLDPLPLDPTPSVFAQLARPLELDPDQARSACVAFNACAYQDRRAFFDVFLRGLALDQVAGTEGISASELARRARTALDASLGAVARSEAGGSGARDRRDG
jgi:hypothetical protein